MINNLEKMCPCLTFGNIEHRFIKQSAGYCEQI